MNEIKPNENEKAFLRMAYNAFYDRWEEISGEEFWEKDSYYRFSKVRDCFLIYSELLGYEPIGWFISSLKIFRPPMEAELSKEFLSFLRNLMVHVPVFKSWDEVYFDEGLLNWSKPGRTMHRFIEKYKGHEQIKYRLWDQKAKKMLYLSINFPEIYSKETKIFLKDILREKEGVLFSLNLMKRAMDSQVEN